MKKMTTRGYILHVRYDINSAIRAYGIIARQIEEETAKPSSLELGELYEALEALHEVITDELDRERSTAPGKRLTTKDAGRAFTVQFGSPPRRQALVRPHDRLRRLRGLTALR